MSSLFPPSTFEKDDFSPCELCGDERNVRDLIEIQGHNVCPDCAQLIRSDGIRLPPRPFLKRISSKAEKAQMRDLILLVCFLIAIFYLAKLISEIAAVKGVEEIDKILHGG